MALNYWVKGQYRSVNADMGDRGGPGMRGRLVGKEFIFQLFASFGCEAEFCFEIVVDRAVPAADGVEGGGEVLGVCAVHGMGDPLVEVILGDHELQRPAVILCAVVISGGVVRFYRRIGDTEGVEQQGGADAGSVFAGGTMENESVSVGEGKQLGKKRLITGGEVGGIGIPGQHH